MNIRQVYMQLISKHLLLITQRRRDVHVTRVVQQEVHLGLHVPGKHSSCWTSPPSTQWQLRTARARPAHISENDRVMSAGSTVQR